MSKTPPESRLKKKEILSSHTSIRLGGPADYFLECRSAEDFLYGLSFADENKIPAFVLGGGSNVLFPDEGYRGIILKNCITGMRWETEGADTILTSGAGENFDDAVRLSAEKGLAGLECLSGIPGSAGAVAVQNAGAYGRETADVFIHAECLDRNTGHSVILSREECMFRYRNSIFKTEARDRYIILNISFRLRAAEEPEILYRELGDWMDKHAAGRNPSGVRSAVLSLRRKKSMVLDDADPHSVSCGSFFTNPVLNEEKTEALKKRLLDEGETLDRIPLFPSSDGYKISAAYLVERSGFPRGYRENGAGVSEKHALALVNYGATSESMISLFTKIGNAVFDRYKIRLVPEPVIVAN